MKRKFTFKMDENEDYKVFENGEHIGYVRKYWDGWRAHGLDGREISTFQRTRYNAASDINPNERVQYEQKRRQGEAP